MTLPTPFGCRRSKARGGVALVLATLLTAACQTSPSMTPSMTPTPTSTPISTPTSTSTQALPPVTWTVRVGPDFMVDELVCGDGDAAVDSVVAEAPGVMRFLHAEREGACVHAFIDLGGYADVVRAREQALRIADDVVLASPDTWLLHTKPARPGRLVFASLPPGFSWHVPFAERADGGYDVDASTWSFLSSTVLGRVSRQRFRVAEADFDVVVLPGELHMVRADVERWVATAAGAVARGQGGRFPVPHTLVIVDPVVGSGVPFGMVQRGGGPHALALLGARSDVRDVLGEWVLVHEFSHLLMPPPALDDTWWGEGMATYFQEVARARAGLRTPEDAWEALRDGFARGAVAAGPPLRTASREMRENGRYLQVYWGGAALALQLDVALRRCSRFTLDDVIASFRAEQPILDVRRVAAREIVKRAAAAAPACAGLVADVDAALDRPFPDVAPLLSALGVAEGRLVPAPEAALRDAITAP